VIYIKKWLCYNCNYCKKEITESKTPSYTRCMYATYTIYTLHLYCNQKLKHVLHPIGYNELTRCSTLKYVTECKLYQNSNLFIKQIIPEYLPKTPFNNECTVCGGRGFYVKKYHGLEIELQNNKRRFEKFLCLECGGTGLIKKIKKVVTV
jgi:hypothetical protein